MSDALKKTAARVLDLARGALFPARALRTRYESFRRLLKEDRLALLALARLQALAQPPHTRDAAAAPVLAAELGERCLALARELEALDPRAAKGLAPKVAELSRLVRRAAGLWPSDGSPPYVVDLAGAAFRTELCGGKAANLGRVAGLAGLSVPPGFVFTTNACQRFLAETGLRARIDAMLASVDLDRPAELTLTADSIQKLVLAAPLPEELSLELEAALAEMAGQVGEGTLLAVRSSAFGEDSDASFAGLHETVLDVGFDDAAQALKTVLASKYCAKAMAYRIRMGLSDAETPMAVLIMAMVPSAVSGVLYTVDPASQDAPCLGLYSVAGFGERLADGSTEADVQLFSRTPPHRILHCHEGTGGVASCTRDHARSLELVQAGLLLEEHFGAPQDIEWSEDARGKRFIVQSRPVRLASKPVSQAASASSPPSLAEGFRRISPGIGVGRVWRLPRIQAVDLAPAGCVLLASSLSPNLTKAVHRLSAVVAATGSAASHFASVAREEGVPVLVGALPDLAEDELVTVDAFSGTILPGDQAHALGLVAQERANRRRTPLSARLTALLTLAAPLTLSDPDAEDFKPERVASLHDAIRYAHESGVRALFGLSLRSGRGMGEALRLDTDLPLDLYLLDLGDGFAADAGPRLVTPEQVACVPFKALYRGLTHPGLHWSQTLRHMDFETFDRQAAGFVSRKSLGSYVLTAKDYVHALMRFGYHFAVVDVLAGEDADLNVAQLRFQGGGADAEHRSWRLDFLATVLSGLGFAVLLTGDLLEASLNRQPMEATLRAAEWLGLLLARTPLYDSRLDSREQALADAMDFLRDFSG